MVAFKWSDAVAINSRNSNKTVDTSGTLRNINSYDTSRQDAVAWVKIMENYNSTSSMDNLLPNSAASSSRADKIEQPVEKATTEKSILEPLIAEALELLIRTDDDGLFYEDVR